MKENTPIKHDTRIPVQKTFTFFYSFGKIK